jgi:predicted Zn-dependent protease
MMIMMVSWTGRCITLPHDTRTHHHLPLPPPHQGVYECPNSVHLHQAWALLESKAGKPERARQLFDRGMKVDPGNPYIAHAWGQLERKEGNLDRARELYATSLKLSGPWTQVRGGGAYDLVLHM